MSEMAKIVFDNVVEPVDPRTASIGKYLGEFETVAVEVAVSKLLRWLLKIQQRSIADLYVLHATSQGLIGGFGAIVFEAPSHIDGNGTFFGGLADGAKGIPALIAAQYVVNTAARGLHIPSFSFKDLLLTGSSKALSRPLLNFMMKTPKLPDVMKQGIQSHDAQLAAQWTAARWGKESNDS